LYFNKIKDCFPDFLKYYKIIKTVKYTEQNKIKSIIDNDYLISIQETTWTRSTEWKIFRIQTETNVDIEKTRQGYEFYMAQYNK
jgi:hypothetical protein